MKKGDIYVVELLSIINTYFSNLRLRPIQVSTKSPRGTSLAPTYIFSIKIFI